MKRTKIFSCLVVALCGFATVVSGQQQILDSIIVKFTRYREQALQEKMYAHLDRNFYLTGETLWFKLYNVDGSFHKPIDVSKVAYVELLDKTNAPVLQAKIMLESGLGTGSFFLPASLNSGHYKFRAYTSWMKNFSPEFYYDQVLTIVNPFVVPEKVRPQRSTYSLAFFPEGGNLVSGIRSKVAFHMTDDAGSGVSCRGVVVDDRGDTLASFTPEKFGLGSFYFTPSHERKYRGLLLDCGTNKTFPLPEVYSSGYVMSVRDSAGIIKVLVKKQGGDDEEIFLFAHSRNIMANAQRRKLSGGTTTFSIHQTALPEGITHLTVFNQALQPVCERLHFIYPAKALDINITANQKIFSTRRRVNISLQTNSPAGIPVPAKLSMAVFKIDSLSHQSSKSVYPYFWLESDLTGMIESPGYYFTTDKAVPAAMDNLMLTHGWRRFDWQEVLNKPRPYAFLPEVRGHIITAEVERDRKKVHATFIHLGSPGKIVRAYGAWSNPQGEVRFEIKDFYGSRRIILQSNDTSNLYDIKVINPFSPLKDRESIPSLILNEKIGETLAARSVAMQVQDIYYYDQYGNVILQPAVDSSAFYGKADATYYLDDYTRFPVMEEVMREYVPGVFVRKRRDGFHFIVVDKVNGGVIQGDPMVLLDGVQVLDVDDIMKVDPLRVKKLEVVNRRYFLGQAVFSGIVSYSTYKADLGGLELNPKSVSLNYDGLQLKRQFYKPSYTREQIDSRLPDQRYLLHWEPDISTDPAGKQQLDFYTSDAPGQYLVVVEGLSNDGYAGMSTYTFSVNAPGSQ